MIKKTVRIGAMRQQGEFRREDMRRMSPAERIAMLIEWRNQAFPYEPLKRVASIRKLG